MHRGYWLANAKDVESWAFELQQIQVQGFEMAAPELIGQTPARLSKIAAGGRVSLIGSRLLLENTLLVCDVGNLKAQHRFRGRSSFPVWHLHFSPMPVSLLLDNWIFPNWCVLRNRCCRCGRTFGWFLGGVQFTAGQHPARPKLGSRVQLTFSDMQAISGDQQVSWNELYP